MLSKIKMRSKIWGFEVKMSNLEFNVPNVGVVQEEEKKD